MQKRFTPDAGGVFPEWEEVTLGDILEINPKTEEEIADEFYYADLASINNGVFAHGNAIKHDEAPGRAQRVVHIDDVLFQSVNAESLGHYHYTKNKELDKQFVASTGFFLLRMKNGCNAFLYQLLFTKAFNQEVHKYSAGSIYTAINTTEFKKIKVRIPKSIEEQRKITAALAAYDEMIAVKTAKLETWQECKKRMVKEIFGRTRRFKDDDGKEFPEWEEKTLGEVAEILKNNVNPQDNKNDSFKEYSMPAYDNEQTAEVRLGAAMKSSRKKMTKPVVLVNKLNVRKKRVWKVSNPESNAVCSAEFVPLASDDMDLDFLQQLCETDDFTKYLIKNTTGTANSLQRVRPEVITNYTFKMPCMKEQQKIGSFLAEIDKEIEIQKEFIKTYAEGKKRMMRELMA